MIDNVRITEHACQRMHERMGLNKKAARRMMYIAYRKGFCKEDVTGQVLRYLEERTVAYETVGIKLFLYGEMVYCFSNCKDNPTLITVYRIPNGLRDNALCQFKKNKVA